MGYRDAAVGAIIAAIIVASFGYVAFNWWGPLSCQKEYDRLEEDYYELDDLYDKLEDDYDDMKDDYEDLEKDYANLQRALDQLEEIIAKNDEEYYAVNKELQNKIIEYDAVVAELEEVGEEYDALNTELENLEKEYEKEYDVIEAELQKLKEKHNETKEQYDLIAEERDELKEEVNRLESRVSSLRHDKSYLNSKINSLNKKIKNLEEKIDELTNGGDLTVKITNPGDDKHFPEYGHGVSGTYTGMPGKSAVQKGLYRIVVSPIDSNDAWDQGNEVKFIVFTGIWEGYQPAFFYVDPGLSEKTFEVIVAKVPEKRDVYQNYECMDGFEILDSVTVTRKVS